MRRQGSPVNCHSCSRGLASGLFIVGACGVLVSPSRGIALFHFITQLTCLLFLVCTFDSGILDDGFCADSHVCHLPLLAISIVSKTVKQGGSRVRSRLSGRKANSEQRAANSAPLQGLHQRQIGNEAATEPL